MNQECDGEMNGVPIKIIYKNAVYENVLCQVPNRASVTKAKNHFILIATEFISDVAWLTRNFLPPTDKIFFSSIQGFFSAERKENKTID